jgi:hypothetical protein
MFPFEMKTSRLCGKTPAINYCQCRCYRRLVIGGVIDTGVKFIAGVMEWLKIISSRIFIQIRNGPNGRSGARGKLIMKKTKSRICKPFKEPRNRFPAGR